MPPVTTRARFAFPALLLCAFFADATFTSVSPFLIEISADLDISEGLTGQLTSVSALAAAVIALPLVPFVDRFAPKQLLVGGVAVVGIASVGTGLAPWFALLLLLQFLVGAASAVTAVSALIALGRIYPDPARRAVRQGLIVGAFGAGGLVGTPILRVIADAGSWRAALVTYGLVALTACTIAAVSLPVMRLERRSSHSVSSRLREAIRAARLPGVRTTLATSALTGLTWGILGAFLAGAFVDRYPGRESWISALWFTDGVAWLIGAALGGLIIARVTTPERILTVALVMMVLAMSSFAWLDAGPAITLLSFGVWALLLGIASNTVLALYTRHAGEHGSAVLFLDSGLSKIAKFLGAVSGGIAIDMAGSYTVWSVLAVTASILAILPLATRQLTRSTTRHPAATKGPVAS
ncbi:MAG TPA: MFS transporter [Thermomicrobiales bacterium]|nr:MFS transporter [Thermomicrobiales bacterium]